MKSQFDLDFDERVEMSRVARRPISNRILTDVYCKVCKDLSSGKHYGIYSCDGCAGFFKRSIRKSRAYSCKALVVETNAGNSKEPRKVKAKQPCHIDKTHRNQCRACRLQKCLEVGMNKDAVQHERGPRNATRNRQAAMMLRESWSPSSIPSPHFPPPIPPPAPILPALHFSSVFPPMVNHASSTTNPSFFSMPAPVFYPVPKYSPVPLVKVLEAPSSQDPFEFSAQTIFRDLKWVNFLDVFTSLPMNDQLIMIAGAWKDMYLISAAQFNMPSIDSLLSVVQNDPDPDRASRFSAALTDLRSIVSQIRKLHLDEYEYDLLKLIVLFKNFSDSSSTPSGITRERVAVFQAHIWFTLASHMSMYWGSDRLRLTKVQNVVPYLNLISDQVIEELFFLKCTNGVPVTKLILDMHQKKSYGRL